jgi:hypothetical protein
MESGYTAVAAESPGEQTSTLDMRIWAERYDRADFQSRTRKRSSSGTRSGSVPLCSSIPRTILRGIEGEPSWSAHQVHGQVSNLFAP